MGAPMPAARGARVSRTAGRSLTAALLLCLISAGARADAAPAASYGVNPGDVLQVYVWNEESLARELLVAPDGTISFPMVGVLRVAEQTTAQIAALIATGLGDFLRDEPLVTVALVGVDGNKIYVHGQVKRPGSYVVTNKVDVLQALAMAGGLDTFANEAQIKVVRRAPDDTVQMFPFDYSRFKNGQGLQSNIVLEPGDVVVVP